MHAEMNGGFIASLALCAALAGGATELPPSEIHVPRVDAAPRVDGQLDDVCWGQAYVSSAFYDFALGKPATNANEDTTLRMVTDGSWLFLGVECRHPDAGDMWAQIKENYGGRIWGDECVKIFLNPGMGAEKQYRYVLNIHNAHENSRSFTVHDGADMLPWPSSVQITPGGWTAELAIPLFELAGYGDLRDFRMNVFRKKIIKERDANAVHVGNNEYIGVWQPATDWADRAEMARLNGLAGLRQEFPFVVGAGNVALGEIREDGHRMLYDIRLELKAMTAQGGTVAVEVEELSSAGEARRFSESFELRPHQIMPATVSVPVENPGRREIQVTVCDRTTDMPFYVARLVDAGGLMQAWTRLNYYTSEKQAEVGYEISVSEKLLAGRSLVVRDATGAILARQPANPAGSLALALADVPPGQHAMELAVADDAGRIMFGTEFALVKYPPRPGHEWKIDRAAGGTLLHDGEPFFPFGFIAAPHPTRLREIAEAGFNAFVNWAGGNTPAEHAAAVQLAQEYGLNIIIRKDKVQNRAEEMQLLQEYFSGRDYKKALKDVGSFLSLKGQVAAYIAPPWNRLSRIQRNAVAAEWLDRHLPLVLDNVSAAHAMPALLGYKTLDEPAYAGADLDVELMRMSRAVKQCDPYHPVFVLYSSMIPDGDRYTDFADALGTDPYWSPGRQGQVGSINKVSGVTARTAHRARARGLMPWTVPVLSYWSNTHKRMLSGRDQICQTWLALIHGTRGIFYYHHQFGIQTEEMWEALKQLAARIKVLAPALVRAPPPQEIQYTPGQWRPLRDEVPDVQARLIQFPDGHYAMLAANVRLSPVKITVQVDGLQDGQLRDLFDGELGAIKAGVFDDTLAARGVRAYAFERIASAGPARASVVIEPLGEAGVMEPGYGDAGRSGRKNIMPNPSLEESGNGVWPDYFIPAAVYRDESGKAHRIGSPDATAGITSMQPRHGARCVFLGNPAGAAKGLHPGRASFYIRLAPQHPTPQPYVLSFYARTDAPEPVELYVASTMLDTASRTTIKVADAAWTRHAVRLTVPPNVNRFGAMIRIGLLHNTGRAYMDALQMEQGMEPTEFEP